MGIIRQDKPFMAEDVGKGPIDVRYLGSTAQYRPTKIIHKADGAVDNGPSFCIVMEHLVRMPVVGQVSLKMLNEALADIGYEIVKKQE